MSKRGFILILEHRTPWQIWLVLPSIKKFSGPYQNEPKCVFSDPNLIFFSPCSTASINSGNYVPRKCLRKCCPFVFAVRFFRAHPALRSRCVVLIRRSGFYDPLQSSCFCCLDQQNPWEFAFSVRSLVVRILVKGLQAVRAVPPFEETVIESAARRFPSLWGAFSKISRRSIRPGYHVLHAPHTVNLPGVKSPISHLGLKASVLY